MGPPTGRGARVAAVPALRPRPGDVVVGVGEYRQAAAPARLRTLLGSCVAVSWWHPGLRSGAMVHVASARRRGSTSDVQRPLAWFAAEAVPRVVRRQLRAASFEPVAWHVGGTGPRIVVLDLHDGSVWVSHTSLSCLGDAEPRLRVGRLLALVSRAPAPSRTARRRTG